MIYYICKYTPVELFAGFGEECQLLNPSSGDTQIADRLTHPNVCSFSRALIQKCMEKGGTLVLTDCCDSIRRAYDVLKSEGHDVYLIGLPHKCADSGQLYFKNQLLKFIDDYSKQTGKVFDPQKFYAAFPKAEEDNKGDYIGITGARINNELLELIDSISPLPIKNNTCTGKRNLSDPLKTQDMDELIGSYARILLSQIPCMRMTDVLSREALTKDKNLRGVIYHTVKFCDYYGFEYAAWKKNLPLPILHIETDWTQRNSGQISTRIEAFFETLNIDGAEKKNKQSCKKPGFYVAGIDIGSTTTNVVIMDSGQNILSFAVCPTGARAEKSSRAAFAEALKLADLTQEQISNTVSTGYGRANISFRGKDVTEITCHAKGAHFLDPKVRTVIDIGGQDSKVIRLDENGLVKDFVMNDKCAAGTGRFLEMMAHCLEMNISQMAACGLKWEEDISISSMCSVFAESEVVSLIAENKKVEDIVHGINKSVATKIMSQIKRVGMQEEYMMTGGVAKNAGVVKAIETELGHKIFLPDEPEICGALGAALIAAGK